MDRRIQKTRNSIYDAFGVLLEKKSYSKITVKNIIDEANIGRSTFYSHFETKDDLLKALCSEIFEHIFSEELVSENTHDFSNANNGVKIKIIHILYHLRDSQRNIKGILSSESADMFLRILKKYMQSLAEEFIRDGKYKELPREFVVNHLSGSLVEMIKWWVSNDMSHSPEELAEYFFVFLSL